MSQQQVDALGKAYAEHIDPTQSLFNAVLMGGVSGALMTNPRILAQSLVDELKKDPNFDESLVEVSIAGCAFATPTNARRAAKSIVNFFFIIVLKLVID